MNFNSKNFIRNYFFEFLRFEFDGDEFKMLKNYLYDINFNLPLWNFVPLFKDISRNAFKTFKRTFNKLINSIENRINHCNKIQQVNEESFLSILFSERKILLEKNVSLDKKLSNGNFARLIHDLFLGSIETTSNTLTWLIIFIKCNPIYELKLREEIEILIGKRLPILKDRNDCHYVMAFLSETLRFRPSVPVSPPHKILENFKIGSFFLNLKIIV